MYFDHLGHLGIFIQMTGLKMSSRPVGELRLVDNSYLIESQCFDPDALKTAES